ncbi:hypothetical protein J5N97_028497 [Dioscorea zingiberensis]|uniref:TOD1/MUCI70 glycosyltransferase-like domain-containing protein n=1 Tax=Dioscorea zingiberensis TaxID=325984 RepID=A0A9D5H4X1_9LILI|nr:hypothetical protein J5N97_028497 [Dioscorea zingiberensis]
MASSVKLNCISISVSDSDSDEAPGWKQSRFRRKRRNPRGRWKDEPFRRALRRAMSWWPVLVFIPAIALLFFEASRLSVKPTVEHSSTGRFIRPEPGSNLNRLDPTTRVVNGSRVACLPILHPEQIQHLEFPEIAESDFPVKKVVYKSDPFVSQSIGNATMLPAYFDSIRFNLFTGNQTLYEREESFKVNETAVVHCGFYSEKGGFKLSEDDKKYMQGCQAVVSTCSFGGGDDLYQPIGMTEASLEKVCYVAFWDEITLAAQEAEGKMILDDHMIGKWRIVIVKNLPFSDQRLNGKIPKMLSHRLFPQARYSIWVDSKSQFRRDPIGVLEALLWRTKSVLAISEHGARSSIYDEGKAVIKKNKATPEEVKVQLNQYRVDGMPNQKRFKGKKALAEASVIVREHTPLTNLFMCLWFNEVVRFTSRDQLSFPYVLWRLGIPGINMFPVCTRKDLVNSMGHKHKVKPLVRSTT